MISSNRMVFLWCAALLCSAALVAQSTAALRGTILDPSGAAVPRATITATGANNVVKVAETNNDGQFAIAGLPAGKYTVRVIATGFSLIEKTVDLTAGRALSMEAKLTVETSKQEVTVADTQQVELDPARNAGALILKEADLDMLSDDPDDLQAELLALAGPAAGPNGGQIFIDGFSGGQLPPKESIREIRINSNPFSAEYDTQGHGRIEIFTKPGTDRFRGMLMLNYGDSLLNSRNPYSPNKPFSDNRGLNVNLSGRISKKASFFLEMSRRQSREAELVNATVLDANFLPVLDSFSLIAPNTRTNFSPRIDYQLTPNITLQGRYSWNKNDAENQGVSGFRLPSTATVSSGTNQNLQLTETWIANPKTINETRFQYFRNRNNSNGNVTGPTINVASAFVEGGSILQNFTQRDNYEFQNYTSITHGTQFIKFGARLRETRANDSSTSNYNGTFTFNSITAYQITRQGQAQGLSLAQIIALGGGPSQYSVIGGTPLVGANQFDAGLFIQDDWRLKPSMTLSLGLRYEVQTNIGDKGDWAPRVGFAWGLGGGQGRLRQPKTVLRAGAGYFYSRFNESNTLSALRFNGVTNVQYVVQNPTFFPPLAPVPDLGSLPVKSLATYHVDPAAHAPTILQTAIGIDRQLPRNITASITYIATRGQHENRTVNINSPLPGTYLGPGTGVFPFGNGIYNVYETTGNYRQNQLFINMNARINARITLFGFYALSHVNSDTNGAPSNPYNFRADYGRAGYDVRNRINVNGSVLLPFGMRVSPNISYNSAPPFNITAGSDLNGDTLFTDRPAFAPAGFAGPACPPRILPTTPVCVVTNQYGSFIPNPTSGMTIIPVNYGQAFGQFTVNARLSRTWGFGERTTTAARPGQQGEGPRGPGFSQVVGAPRGGGGGGPRGPGGDHGGMGGMFGGGDASSGRKYTFTLGIFFHNLLNTVNPGSPDGNLLSPQFGQPRGLAGGGFGGFGGGGSQGANRRIDLSLRFNF